MNRPKLSRYEYYEQGDITFEDDREWRGLKNINPKGDKMSEKDYGFNLRMEQNEGPLAPPDYEETEMDMRGLLTPELVNLEDLLEIYRDMKADLAPAIQELKELEKTLKAHVMETGEGAEVDGAAISIRSGYTRTSWDGRALKGYAAAHPEILEFQTVKEIGPAVVIKVSK